MTLTPLKAVRAYCLWCCLDSSPEVRICPSEECALWPYRHGHNPKMAQTGLTATYTVDEKMTARKAALARCRDCFQMKGDCHCPDCALHQLREDNRRRTVRASTRPISGAAAQSRLGGQASTMQAESATVAGRE